MGFDRISILGVGLMGGSVGLACREATTDSQIVGYSHRPDEVRRAVERGAIHEGTSDPIAAVAHADLVILCTPVGLFSNLMNAIAPALKPSAIVTDVGSTKRSIVRLSRQVLSNPGRFIGSHPMVGGEKHGIDHARADLLAGALCILTPDEATDLMAMQQVEQFWQMLKMRTVKMTPEAHDELTCLASHLPHAIAAALVKIQTPESLQLVARGFLDTTRIDAGESALWRDMFLDNRHNLRDGIVQMQNELLQLLTRLDAGDAVAVQEWLNSAASLRMGLNRS